MLSNQTIDPNDPNAQRFVLFRWVVQVWQWIVPPSVAHADRESDAKRILRASMLVSLFLTLIVVVVILVKPAGESIKAYQANSLLRDAQRAIDNKDLPTAVAYAQKAFVKSPEHEASVRMNAELLTKAGRAEALHYWKKLEDQGTASIGDRIGRVRALLSIGQAKDARVLWERLVKENPENKELLEMAAQMWGSQHTTGIAMDALKKVTSADANDRDNAFRLATLQLKTAKPEEVRPGWARLWDLCKGQDNVALQAMRLLHATDKETDIGITKLDVQQRVQLANQLDAHPDADGTDHTAALGLRLQMAPREKDSLIAACIEHFFKGKPPADLDPMVRWLVHNGEPLHAINIVDLNQVKNRKDCQNLILNYLTALTRLQRLADLEAVINDKELKMSSAVRTYHQAVLAMLKGASLDTLKEKFRIAIRYAAEEGQWMLLLSLGNFCLDWKIYDVGIDAFIAVAGTGNPKLAPIAYEGWMRCARTIGDTTALFNAARTANQFWPEDRNFQEQLLYMKLLLGAETEVSLSRAQALLHSNSDDAVRKIVAALGEYRLGDLASAVTTCQNIALDDLTKGHPEKIAIFAALYYDAGALLVAAGDGHTFAARLEVILNCIPADCALLAEERTLLDRVRAGLSQLKAHQAGR
jgi:tetratricopeptide (TPR) repeat protein